MLRASYLWGTVRDQAVKAQKAPSSIEKKGSPASRKIRSRNVQAQFQEDWYEPARRKIATAENAGETSIYEKKKLTVPNSEKQSRSQGR